MIATKRQKIAVVIPTYNREEVLVNTIKYFITDKDGVGEILVIDQTIKHSEKVEAALSDFSNEKSIRWVRVSKPSQPRAMNIALALSRFDILLFVDDDIVPIPNLAAQHIKSYEMNKDIWAVMGRVMQPEEALRLRKGNGFGRDFQFNSEKMVYVENAMSGNLSVKREKAILVGGFDENFIGAAYKFDSEFAERVIRYGGKILFNPDASIDHLRAQDGGVRTFGDFKKTISPAHAVGAYYYFLRSKKIKYPILESMRRFLASVWAKYYILRPWWIPITLIAELSGFFLAIFLIFRGPKLMKGNNC